MMPCTLTIKEISNKNVIFNETKSRNKQTKWDRYPAREGRGCLSDGDLVQVTLQRIVSLSHGTGYQLVLYLRQTVGNLTMD